MGGAKVAPAHDDAGELTRYADNFSADRERWLFLTGPEKELDHLIAHDFHLGVDRSDGREVTHSTKLALVDRRGHVRGYFDGQQADDLPKLRQAIAVLLRESP